MKITHAKWLIRWFTYSCLFILPSKSWVRAHISYWANHFSLKITDKSKQFRVSILHLSFHVSLKLCTWNEKNNNMIWFWFFFLVLRSHCCIYHWISKYTFYVMVSLFVVWHRRFADHPFNRRNWKLSYVSTNHIFKFILLDCVLHVIYNYTSLC